MGWTSFSKWECERNARGNVDRRATMTHEVERYGDQNVVKAAMGGGNYYAVVRNVKRDEHYLLVCLTKVSGGEFWYKDMSDTMGPVYYDCPKSILDLADKLCPCDERYDPHGYAKAWRDKCREQIRVRNSPTAFAKCKPYEQVLWHIPKDSGITCGGTSLAGRTVKLTKVPRRRQWQCYELGARVATKFVNPLDCELVTEEGDWASFAHIKGWYMRNYPTDGLGNEIDSRVTFKDLYDRMEDGEDVYEVIGVGDSVVRERLFDELAKRRHVSYDTIYRLWLSKAA